MHLIPNDEYLWETNKFDNFLEERGKLITNKFKQELNT